MKKPIATVLFFILLFSFCVFSFAQEQPPQQLQPVPSSVRIRKPVNEEKDEYRMNIELVNELLRVSKPEEALQVLVQMKGVYGETDDVHRLFKDAYIANKQYDKVEQIIKNDMAQNPNNWLLYTELANVYFKWDRGEEARWNLNHALELVPEGSYVYKEVGQVYLLNGLTSEAMDTYKLARMKLGDPSLFAINLAGLYEALFDYQQATEEYFLFMGDDSTRFDVVEDRVNRLIQSEQHLDEIELALQRRIKNNKNDIFSHRLYADLLFGRENLDGAFEAYRKVDELSDTKGQYILKFIRMCHTKGYFDQAINASQYLISKQPSKEVVVSAIVYKAYCREGQEKYEDAIDTYQSVIDEYGTLFPAESALSHYKIGEIKLHHLRKPDEAFVHFQTVISGFHDSPLYPDALVRLGDCMMAQGDLDSANVLFEKALNDPMSEPKLEELKYKLAELEFYWGNFEEALKGYGQLVSEFPKGLYINNSLERTVVITENQDMDRPLLARFTRALLDNVQGKVDSAIIKLDGLISAKSQKLSDLAQLEKAKILKQEKKYEQSLRAFNELLDKYPESLYRAKTQMLIGDVYNYHLGDRPKAIQAYEKLLKDYERSVYADEVRDKLRELKAEITPTSSG